MNLNNEKIKVIIIGSETINHYRVELFNLLSDTYDVTIAHPGEPVTNAKFRQVKIDRQYLGSFISLKKLPLLSNFQVVIFPFNIRIVTLYKLFLSRQKYRLLLFGIGVSASYANGYDAKKRFDFIRRFFIKRSDGAIFYEHYPVTKYQSHSIDPCKLHVAYNTVIPPSLFQFSKKTFENFLFIGTLYKQKKIHDLLDAYLSLYKKIGSSIPKLEIVGDGEEYATVENWIHKNRLADKILLHGKLTDEEQLMPVFYRALVCISPGQAGLSVQKCFSYGTPFVTTKKAITGGELFSIIDRVNGFLYDGSVADLTNIMYSIWNGEIDIKEVSRKAHLFYTNFRTPEIWLAAFKKAIG